MIKPMYTLYDEKAQAYATPFTSPNLFTALRSFHAAKNDPQTDIYRFPNDFTLYEIGSFDDSTGFLTALNCPVNHGKATQFNTLEV